MGKRLLLIALVCAGLTLQGAVGGCGSQEECAAPAETQGEGGSESPISGTVQSLVQELTLDELIAAADAIVIGSVVSVTGHGETDRGMIYSSVVISIENVIKGTDNDTKVTITVPGGKVNGLEQWVEDTPHFDVFERVLVFLQPGEEGNMNVVGGFQGKRSIAGNKIAGSDVTVSTFIDQIESIMENTQ